MEVLTQCLSYVKHHFARVIFALFLLEDFWSFAFFGRFKVGARYVWAESEKKSGNIYVSIPVPLFYVQTCFLSVHG